MSAVRHGQAADIARERYADGCNCAQAVLGALSGQPGVPTLPESLGAGYTTGIGGSGCVCGALAGGVAVLSEYAAAQGLEPAATRRLAEELSAQLHSRFTKRFGSACCRVIKRGETEGSDEWLSECASLTEETAAMVADVIAAQTGARAAWTARDAFSLARRAAQGTLAGGAIVVLFALVAPTAAYAPALVLALAAIAVTLEFLGAGGRRAGRVLRVSGAIAAALLAVGVLFAPGAAATLAQALLAPATGMMLAARAVLALAALVAAGASAFALKRYR